MASIITYLPTLAVLLMEYIWSLEILIEKVDIRGDFDEDYPDPCDIAVDTDFWFMGRVAWRAIYLWQGEQVDGSIFKWGREKVFRADDILELPGAVMAGYRYLTSLKSSPRYLRAPMHWSLFNKGLYM